MKISFVYILITLMLFTCTKEEITSRAYPRVQTESVETITSDGVLMKGEITFNANQILDHGFLWSSGGFPDIDKAEKISFGAKNGIGKFEALADRNLQVGVTYSMRAYARSASHLVYGQVREFVSQGCKNKPVISNFIPKQGTTGDIVTIQGDFFSTILANSVVNFGELNVDILTASQNQLQIRIPTTTNTGLVNIKVISNGNQVMSTEKFILKGARIDDFTPKVAVIAATLVQITGADYGTDKASLKVTFAGKVCEIVELTDSRVVIKLPPDSPVGAFPLVVEKDGKINLSTLNCTSLSPWSLEYSNIDTWFSLRGALAVINNKAYIRTRGSTGSSATNCCQPLWWEYSMASNSFVSRANFIGPESSDVIGLSIGSKGYLVNTSTYEYDPALNSWHFSESPPEDVSKSLGFESNGLGYVVGGNLQSSVVVFNPSTTTWSRLNPIFPIGQLNSQSGFIINNNIFIGLGWTSNYAFNNKFWRYDIAANSWSEVKSFPGQLRANAISFVINGKGYVGGGSTTSNFFYDFWEYDPALDKWARRADLPSTLKGMNSFSDSGKGYVTSGFSPEWTIWSYDPNK